MAVIRKNPTVRDYFTEVPEVSLNSPVPSVTQLLEEGKVVVYPNLRLKIDHDFWASFDTSPFPNIAKVMTVVDLGGDLARDRKEREARIRRAGVPDSFNAELASHMESLLDQVLPVYKSLFSGYRFTRGNIAWRLNDIHATKMHIDCYEQPHTEHFVRMFINLDSQPRIWHTSWHIDELIEQVRGQIPESDLRALSANDLWTELNKKAFGATVDEWWREVQRHAVFFAPGDCWSVDSRIVGHQIFYGRRAVSIDFVVDPASMVNPEGHYLRRAEVARSRLLDA